MGGNWFSGAKFWLGGLIFLEASTHFTVVFRNTLEELFARGHQYNFNSVHASIALEMMNIIFKISDV